MGLSNYTARFTDFDATLNFDPDDPAASSVNVTINPHSVETDHPTKAESWNMELGTTTKWFNGSEFGMTTMDSILGDDAGLIIEAEFLETE